MVQKSPMRVLFSLLPLMAAAGMIDGAGSLLMVFPFLLLVGLLIIGVFPGERLIEAMISRVATRPRANPGSQTPPGRSIPRPRWSLWVASIGSRGPPFPA